LLGLEKIILWKPEKKEGRIMQSSLVEKRKNGEQKGMLQLV